MKSSILPNNPSFLPHFLRFSIYKVSHKNNFFTVFCLALIDVFVNFVPQSPVQLLILIGVVEQTSYSKITP